MAWILQHLLHTRGRQPTVRGPDLALQASHPAHSPFTNCSNFVAHVMVLHFINLPSLQLLALYTYEEQILRNRTVL